jgi:GntR family transcriptional regulator
VILLVEADYRAPLYLQLRAKIENKISSGDYLSGDRIPSERQLADAYKVSRVTVKKAIESLIVDGLLYSKQGRGTFVSRPVKKSYSFNFGETTSKHGLTAILKRSGARVKTSVLRVLNDVESDYIKTQLNLTDNESVFGLHRLRESNGSVFAVEYTYVPAQYFVDINQVDFRNVGLYDYLEQRGHGPKYFQQYLKVIEAGPREAKLLNLKPRTPVFKINFISGDAAGRIVEFTESYINTNKVSLEYSIRKRL